MRDGFDQVAPDGNAAHDAGRIRELFDRAIDAPPAEWEAVLAPAADGNKALFDSVMRLLAAAHEDTQLFEHPRFLADDDSRAEERLGSVVARYRLMRLVGSGGMGTVYEGLRADEAYEQRVAVKVVRPTVTTSGMADRFRDERQILATLEHRNIARLLDGGETEQGDPFFVMEFVEGTSITKYCDKGSLSINDRLKLFLQACNAVQHAHGKLVVHRDLKPANILVTSDGSVKLLDFGVATLLRARAATHPGDGVHNARLITPEYASPEQLRGAPASVVSDVYSLGAVLYELIAGRRPFVFGDRTTRAALDAMELEAAPPSESVSAQAAIATGMRSVAVLRRKLRGDLDDIACKALRLEPSERYESVQQFADDLRRYLAGQPVLAHGDSLPYRTRKYVHLHWPGITAAAVAAAALLAGSVAALLQSRKSDVERARSAQVSAFLQDMLAAPDARNATHPVNAQPGSNLSDILDAAADRAGIVLTADPAVESVVRKTLGRTYTAIGKYDQGVTQLTLAIGIDRRIGAPALPDIATDLNDLGESQLERGNNYAADTLFRAELEICRTGDRRADTAHVCVTVLNNLGGATWFENKLAESEELYRHALIEHRRTFGPDALSTAIVLGNLGGVLDARGKLNEAERRYREALDVYASIGGRYLPQRAFTLTNLAQNLERRGQFVAASALVREAIDVISRSSSPNHPDAALAWIQLGGIDREAGNVSLAEAETARGLKILPRDGPIARRLYVQAITRVALLQLAERKPGIARATIATALDSASLEFSPEDPRFAEVQDALGQILVAQHDRPGALRALEASHATLAHAFGERHPETALVARHLADARSGRD
ncbi:MAG: serine/threonine-protein kinase [Gemmatimonadota bacterium]|nr:serine/threonine-protein kinase [Gemmatimonadota bacterium]